jgi:hypothetical protein
VDLCGPGYHTAHDQCDLIASEKRIDREIEATNQPSARSSNSTEKQRADLRLHVQGDVFFQRTVNCV